MTRISKKYIKEEIIMKLYRLFFEVFSRSNNQEGFLSLINDLLSSTEKIMIAKRIGIIYLLIKKVDYRTIAETLKVSTATVLFYSVIFQEKQTKMVNTIKQMLKQEKVLNFLDDLFADIFIQPEIYIGHHQRKWEHKKRQEERKILPV